jgi:hypothetical protein
MPSSVYVVVYGDAPYQFQMYESYQDAVKQLRIRALNNPLYTSHIDIYRSNEEGVYEKDVHSDDDEW